MNFYSPSDLTNMNSMGSFEMINNVVEQSDLPIESNPTAGNGGKS